jgi:starch synthase
MFSLDATKPLIVFIGRLVGEKAADILPDSILASIYSMQNNVCFLILGSGEADVEWRLNNLTAQFPGNYNAVIGYNEKLSHQMYAGADFLLMPSRVEPCGLNQMYAMRYGTVPMVRSTGGLRDTVIDMGDEEGYGIRFIHASVGDIIHSVNRAVTVYQDQKAINLMRTRMMAVDNSWDKSAQQYVDVYQSL